MSRDPTSSETYFERLSFSSLERLTQAIVPGTSPKLSYLSRHVLAEHDEMLMREFCGKRELLLFHALVTVRIRRGINLPVNIKRFKKIWLAHSDLLCTELDSRWLASACETIVDHWPNNRTHDRSLALAGSLLLCTIKLYETERLMQPSARSAGEFGALIDQTSGPLHLFDGVIAFLTGRGDMPHNLATRLERVCSDGGIPGKILMEMFQRTRRFDTVYKRFLDVHTSASTRW